MTTLILVLEHVAMTTAVSEGPPMGIEKERSVSPKLTREIVYKKGGKIQGREQICS